MKRLSILAVLCVVGLTGCISPNWMRLIPENKDADVVLSTPYGTVTIHTRVNPQGSNALPSLPKPAGE